jgi:hypothetical protein
MSLISTIIRRVFPSLESRIPKERNIHVQVIYEVAFKNANAAATRLLAPVRNVRRDKPVTMVQLVERNLVTGPFLHYKDPSPNFTPDLLEGEDNDQSARHYGEFRSMNECICIGGRWQHIHEFMASNEFDRHRKSIIPLLG